MAEGSLAAESAESENEMAEASDVAAESDGGETESDGGEGEGESDGGAAFDAYYRLQRVAGDDDEAWARVVAAFGRRLPVTVRAASSGEGAFAEALVRRRASAWRPVVVDGRLRCFAVEASGRGAEVLAAAQELGFLLRQEVVSCVAPALLGVGASSVVADLCASPGSKTLQLLDGVRGGVVVASEVDRKRLGTLVRRARRSGRKAALVALCADARRFPGLRRRNGWKQKFDAVLCDAPCSGDGTLRKKPALRRRWRAREGLALHALQVAVLVRGLALLKHGGRLCYSTCSLNPIEDEAVVAAALAAVGVDFVSLVDVPKWAVDASTPGLTDWRVPTATFDGSAEASTFSRFEDVPPDARRGKKKQKGAVVSASMFPPAGDEILAMLPRARRFLPTSALDSGGFFVAVFERSDRTLPQQAPRAEPRPAAPPPPPPPPACEGGDEVREGDWRCDRCGTNNFGAKGRSKCFACKARRRPVLPAAPRARLPPLLAAFGAVDDAPVGLLDAFLAYYGLSSSSSFPVERCRLLRRPKRRFLVLVSEALGELAISDSWQAVADAGVALCAVVGDDVAAWPLLDEGLRVLARFATRRVVSLSVADLRAVAADGTRAAAPRLPAGSCVVAASVAVDGSVGTLALGGHVDAAGTLALTSSDRLTSATRVLLEAALDDDGGAS